MTLGPNELQSVSSEGRAEVRVGPEKEMTARLLSLLSVGSKSSTLPAAWQGHSTGLADPDSFTDL